MAKSRLNQFTKKQVYSTDQSGSILVFGVLSLSVCLFLLCFFVYLVKQIQTNTMHRYRLDICAIDIATQQIKRMHRLTGLNHRLSTLRKIVYAGRLATFIPGIGAISKSAEQAALLAMRATVLQQNIIVTTGMYRDFKKARCNNFLDSKRLAICHFATFSPMAFSRSKTLFLDVPGNLQLRKEVWHVACAIPTKYFRLGMFVKNKIKVAGDYALHRKIFHYEFKQ